MSSHDSPAAEIAAVQRRFLQLFAANDVAALGGCYTEDARMLVANMQPIQGRAAIQSVFKFTAVQGHTLEWQAQELDVQGQTAIELGRYIRRTADGSVFDRGNYVVVWKRVADAWLIHRDMFSTSVPRTALAPA